MNIEIANRLVELRKKRGFSQEALAQELGISRQAVSKWERAESSPDTDNLILLAKLYEVSLDELLKMNVEDMGNLKGSTRMKDEEPKANKPKNKVHIGFDGIHIIEDEEEVHVGWSGVHIISKNDEFKFNDSEIFIKGYNKDDDFYMEFDEDEDEDRKQKFIRKTVFLDYIPYGVIAIITFLYLGFFQEAWHPGWLILLTIPIYDSLATVFRRKKLSAFNYSLLTIVIFSYLVIEYETWHPTWTIFLTIPLFYYLIGYFKNFKR